MLATYCKDNWNKFSISRRSKESEEIQGPQNVSGKNNDFFHNRAWPAGYYCLEPVKVGLCIWEKYRSELEAKEGV